MDLTMKYFNAYGLSLRYGHCSDDDDAIEGFCYTTQTPLQRKSI